MILARRPAPAPPRCSWIGDAAQARGGDIDALLTEQAYEVLLVVGDDLAPHQGVILARRVRSDHRRQPAGREKLVEPDEQMVVPLVADLRVVTKNLVSEMALPNRPQASDPQ